MVSGSFRLAWRVLATCPFHKSHPAQKSSLFGAMPRSVEVMRKIIVPVLRGLFSSFRTRVDLQLEVAVLRHQVEVLQT